MSFSMQELAGNDQDKNQSQPAAPASNPQATPAAQPPNTVVNATPASPKDPNSFSMTELGSPSQGTVQADADEKAKQAQEDAARKAEISKHGLIHRAWDWVNQPVFDNVLPEGIKTSDIVKAIAFEKMYNEAYIPGVNDFDTKAEVHLGGVGGNKKPTAQDAQQQQQNLAQQKGVVRKFIEAHANDQSLARAIVDPEARQNIMQGLKTGVAGAAKDTADMASGFTSPLSLATMGLGSVEFEAIPAVGKIAKAVNTLAGTAFGLQGAYNTVKGLYHMGQQGVTPENVQETLGGASQATMGAAAPLHVAQGALTDAVRPVTKTIAGQDVPVRPEGFIANAAAKSVDQSVLDKATGKTATAVQQGIGNVAGEGSGSEATTALGDRDRFGVRGHAEDLQAQSKPAYQELDALSDNAFSDAQARAKRSRLDFSTEGREKYEKALADQDDIMHKYRNELADKGYDVDEIAGNYRKSVAMGKIADKLDIATGPKAGGGYEVDGQKLANQIDRLRRAPEGKNLFDKAGLTSDHVQALSDLADTLRKEQVKPQFGGLTRLAAKALAIAGAGGGGISGLAEALTGESMAEKIGSKVVTSMLGDAMTSEPAARALNTALQGGPTKLGVWDGFKQAVNKVMSSQRGAIGADIEQGNAPQSNKFGRAGVGGKPLDFSLEKGLPDENGVAQHTLSIDSGDEHLGVLNIEQGSPDSWTIKDAALKQGETGKGYGRQAYEQAFKEASDAGMKTVDSDISMSTKAASVWKKLQAAHPDAVTEENGQYSVDLDKLNNPPQEDEETTPAFGNNPESEISTRSISSGSGKTFNRVPNDPTAVTGMDAIEQAEQQKPGYMRDLLDKVLSYKDNGLKLTPEQIADPKAGLKAVVDHWADNLTWLHDKMPPELRQIAKQWYDSAHKMSQGIADKYGTTNEKVAASIAAISPQNPWDVNVGQAERVVKAYMTARNHPWTPEMDQALSKKIADSLKGKKPQVEYAENLKKIRGKTFDELENPKKPDVGNYNQALWTTMYEKAHGNPQTPTYAPDGTIRGYQTFNFGLLDGAAKALAILKGDGSPQSIHDIIGDGHKIRNFYNNIISPNSELGHATIDTHHVNADMLKPMSSKNDVEVKDNFGGAPSHKGTGQKGTYSLHHEALKQAAAARGILPREMQSITWEGIKTLMGDEKKTPELRKAVTEIWQQHQAGELTLNEARDKIVKAAGGFDKPGWAKEREANAQSNTGSDEGRGSTADAGELPTLGVRGESASGPRARSGGNVPAPVSTEGRGARSETDWAKAVKSAKRK
jgi:hypothetical protein